MEAFESALQEFIVTVLLAVVTGAVGYFSYALKRLLKNRRLVAYMDALRKDHEAVYEALVDLALAAEKMAFSEVHEFTKSDRYEFVRDGILEYIRRVSEDRGIPLKVDEAFLDALIERAVVEAERVYWETQGRKPHYR